MAKGDFNEPWIVNNRFLNRTDSFVVEGSGITIDACTGPVKDFAIQVKSTTAVATDWNVVLEGSLDNINFTTILTHVAGNGDGLIVFSGATASPCVYFRSRVVSLTLGDATNIVVKILGM